MNPLELVPIAAGLVELVLARLPPPDPLRRRAAVARRLARVEVRLASARRPGRRTHLEVRRAGLRAELAALDEILGPRRPVLH